MIFTGFRLWRNPETKVFPNLVLGNTFSTRDLFGIAKVTTRNSLSLSLSLLKT